MIVAEARTDLPDGAMHDTHGAGHPAELAARLAKIAQAIATPRDAIEGAFLNVGGRLGECAQILSRLTATFDSLPGDLESPELSEATDRLAVVGRRAGDFAVALQAEHGDLHRLVEALAAAAHPIGDLERSVKMMGIVAINARVVAASVVDEREDFSVFTTDIAQLSNSAAGTIADFSRTYQQLTVVVGEAALARSQFEAAHATVLTALAIELAANLDEVTQQRHASASSSATTGQMSRAIAERVAQTVMALQVGDATRQRLEHIEAALMLPLDAAAEDPETRPIVAELQRLQLSAAREALITEMASGADALTQLASEVEAMLTHARSVYGSPENRSALATLHAAVRRAVAVLRHCEGEQEKLDKVASAVSTTVRVLLDHVEAVQEIEYKMRLVSLNAAVKCAQLGPRGRALDVIAQQLRSLTGETVASAHKAVECLNQAAAFSAAFTGSAGSGTTRVGDLEREGTAALNLLETVGLRLKTALIELYDDGPEVGRKLLDAVDHLANHAAISEALSDLEFDLGALTPMANGALPAMTGPVKEHLALLRGRYTMDAERRVHDAFTAIPVESGQEAEVSLDDLLF